MGKNVSLEIATPMRAIEPSAVADVASQVNQKIVEKLGLLGGWVTDYETQRAQRALPTLVRPVNDFRYIHYARSAPKSESGLAPSEMIGFITSEDPNYRLADSIGDMDLLSRIKDRLAGEIGRCSVEEMIHRFDDVEIVNPIKDKQQKHKVVVLRQLSHLTDPESVTALDIISEEVKNRISTHYPLLDALGIANRDEVVTTVERGIPIASVYLQDTTKQEFDPNTLTFIRKYFFDHLVDPTFDFVSQQTDISHES